jgi:predicted nucleic acid-binding protein
MPFPGDSAGSSAEKPPLPAASGGSAHQVVSNTTPLITLGEIGLLDALRELCGEVWIPDFVFAEYHRGRAAHPQRADLQESAWVSTHSAAKNTLVPASLHAGERDARTVAARLHLTVTGSVGILLAAKCQGVIRLVKPYLDEIIAQR